VGIPKAKIIEGRGFVYPAQRRSLPSLAPRHTVHPEHKKARGLGGQNGLLQTL